MNRRITHGIITTALFAGTSVGLTSCMTEPADGGHVCGKDVIMVFSGLVPNPGVAVSVQASPTRTGPFSQIAIATSEAAIATTQDGVDYYAWKVYAAVPSWVLTRGHYEAYVQATSGGTLSTFSASPGYVSCVRAKVTRGKTFSAAAVACRSPNSSLAKLIAPQTPAPVTLNEDVLVASMADAARYGCVSHVNGNVAIDADVPAASGITTGAPITLPYLAEVGPRGDSPGDVSLRYLAAGTPAAPKLSALPLARVAGNLSITTPSGGPMDFGLALLTSVGGDLSIDYHNQTARGLAALAHVPGNVWLRNGTDALFNADFLPSLMTVGGDVTLEYGFQLNGLLNHLQHVGGDVVLDRAFGPELHDGELNSFTGLIDVGGRLVMSRVAFAQSNVVFPHLTSVQGELVVGGSQFLSLNIGPEPGAGGPALSIGSLIVRENPNLGSIVPGRIRVQDAGPIAFIHNLCLPTASVAEFLNAQQIFGWSGPAFNSSNGHDCGLEATQP